MELKESEIDCWAVCDDDGMRLSYAELLSYADEHGVRLGFSRPQFECFLLQHFEQSGETDISKVFSRLPVYRERAGGCGPYDESSKSDLGWLADAIFEKPKLVDAAVVNADLRGRQSGDLFLTVQGLVKELGGLQRG